MNNFKSIGAEYVNEYSNSEDAWEFAFSNDQRVIDALTNNTPDDRAEAADEFGTGFTDAYVGEPEVEKTKVILVGRHVADLPADIEVIEQRNVTWPLDAQECGKQWAVLGREAYDMGAALLLQNVPGVLAVAIARGERLAVEYETNHNPKWGVIISVPGPRTAGVVTEYTTAEPSLLVKALKDANGRAKVEITGQEHTMYDPVTDSEPFSLATVRLTVDPVAEFKFDHIEWM